MKTEQTISIPDFRKILELKGINADITFQRKKGQVGTSLEIEVKIKPPIPEKEHDVLVKSIIDHYGEDLLEVYTEETGHWFFVYIRMSPTVPTTVIA